MLAATVALLALLGFLAVGSGPARPLALEIPSLSPAVRDEGVRAPAATAAGVLACGTTVLKSVKLTADVGPCTGTTPGLIVGASSIVINCQGHNITGTRGVSGISESSSYSVVTIENCNISAFYGGLDLSGSGNKLLHDQSLDNSGYGFLLYGSGNTLRNDSASGNSYAGYLLYGSSNTLRSDTANGNYGSGFVAAGGSDVLVSDVADSAMNGYDGEPWDGFLVSGTTDSLTSDSANGNYGSGFGLTAASDSVNKSSASYNGAYGFTDQSSGSGTGGTGNTYSRDSCTDNVAGGSSPSGLCNARNYTIRFSETGLASGTNWNVSVVPPLGSPVNASSVTSLIEFKEPNGSYSYSIEPVPGYRLKTGASSGSFTVDGSNPAKIDLVWSPVKYAVKFEEKNLVAGTNWSVTVDGQTRSSVTKAISINLANGTYAFAAEATGYVYVSNPATPIAISGSKLTVSVSFAGQTAWVYGWDEFSGALNFTASNVTWSEPNSTSLNATFNFVGASAGTTYVPGIALFWQTGSQCVAALGQFTLGPCLDVTRQGVTSWEEDTNDPGLSIGSFTTNASGDASFAVSITGVAPGTYTLEFWVNYQGVRYQSPGPFATGIFLSFSD